MSGKSARSSYRTGEVLTMLTGVSEDHWKVAALGTTEVIRRIR